MPKISIIIPIFNTEKYLNECLDSVVNQTFKDIEIICIDDGSTDNSLQILKEYANKDERITVICGENQGAASVRNKGIEISNGEYIIFLDSDDYLDLRALEYLYAKAVESNSDLIVYDFYNFDNITKNITYNSSIYKKFMHPFKNVFSYDDYPKTILNTILPSPCNRFMKKIFIKKNNLYFQNVPYFNDVYFATMSLIKATKVTAIEKALYYYRVNREKSTTSLKFKDTIVLFQVFDLLFATCKQEEILNKFKYSLTTFTLNFFMYYFENTPTELRKKIHKEIMHYINSNSLFGNMKNINISCFILNRYNCWFKNYDFTNVKNIKNKTKFKKIIKNIFSIQNVDARKCITLLGVKIKIRNEKLKQKIAQRKKEECLNSRIKFLENKIKECGNYKIAMQNMLTLQEYDIKENTVLIIEPTASHGEVIPGYVKYFHDLGYNIDILIRPELQALNPLARLNLDNVRLFTLQKEYYNEFFKKKSIKNYKLLFFTSHLMYEWVGCMPWLDAFGHFPELENLRNKIYTVEHHLDTTDKNLLENKRVVALANLPHADNLISAINPHYFGDINVTSKNSHVTNFIMVGAIEKERRNCDLMFKAVEYLHNKKISNFKVTVVGRGNLGSIPSEIRSYFNVLGRIPYDKMYSKLEMADFFLPLLDPENVLHERYITDGTSGSFQLIYGFKKIAIIAEKFASIHNYNEDNSIIYKSNADLGEAMEKAIQMSNTKYIEKQNNLQKTTDIIYQQSLQNLKSII